TTYRNRRQRLMSNDDKIYADTPDGLARAAAEIKALRGEEPAVEAEPVDMSIEGQYTRCRELMLKIEAALGIKDRRDEAFENVKPRVAEREAGLMSEPGAEGRQGAGSEARPAWCRGSRFSVSR